MKTFKTHLYLLVLFLSFQTVAFAVHISSEGLGQVLLFPHYQATKNSYTSFSITNSKNSAKALRLRFTHPETGDSVATFNLYLSPHATWKGEIKENKKGLVELLSDDKSCLFAGQKLEWPQRGGLEVLEMATFKDFPVRDCESLSKAWNENGIFKNEDLALPPSGGLFGKSEVVVGTTTFAFQPMVLDAWRNLPFHTPSTEIKPDLSDVVPKISAIAGSRGITRSNWNNNHPVAPVTAILMSSKLINIYQADITKSESTDILFSFPTKNFYNHNPCVLGKLKFHERPSNGRQDFEKNLQLCFNSAVLSIHNDLVLSLNDSFATEQYINLTSGQAHLDLVGLELHSDEGHIYKGLPALSYSVSVNKSLTSKSLPLVQTGKSRRIIVIQKD